MNIMNELPEEEDAIRQEIEKAQNHKWGLIMSREYAQAAKYRLLEKELLQKLDVICKQKKV